VWDSPRDSLNKLELESINLKITNNADTFNVNASGAKLDEECLEDNIISLIIKNISRVFRDGLHAKTSEIDIVRALE